MNLAKLKVSWLYALGFVVWFIVTAIVSLVIVGMGVRNATISFNEYTSALHEYVQSQAQINAAVLDGFAALMVVISNQDRDKAKAYTRQVLFRYPHIYRIELIRRVTLDDRDAFILEQRQRGIRHYEIKAFSFNNDRNWSPVQEKSVYYPIEFFHSTADESAQVLGMDVDSVDFLREALRESMVQRTSVATRPFRLIQGTQGYALYRPVEDRQSTTLPAAGNESQDKLFVALVVKAESMLPTTLSKNKGFNAFLYHSSYSASDPQGKLFEIQGARSKSTLETLFFPVLRFNKPINEPGQPFVLAAERQLSWHDVNGSLLTLVLGFTLMALGSFLVFIKVYHKSELALRESKYRHSTALKRSQEYLDVTDTMIMALDKQARITLINRAGCELLGFSKDELLGKDWIENVIPVQLKNKVRAVFNALMHGEETALKRVTDHAILNRWGEIRNLSWHNTLLRNEQGRIVGTLSSGVDITERKRAEDALRQSEARLRQIIDLVPYFIFAKDHKGTILLANKAQAEAYGTTVEELVGRNHRELHKDDEEVAHMLADDLEVIESKRAKFIAEEGFTDYAGNTHILQTTKIPFTESGTNEPAILGVAIDITARKQVELALQEAKDQADQANLQKSRFLAAASHDLRQPLQALSLLNGVLLKKVDDEDLLKIVQNQSNALNSIRDMLDALLDIRRLEAGKITPEIIDFKVQDLLDRIGIHFREQSQAKRLTLRLVASSATVRSDPTLLQRIVENLVSNAIEHTDTGTVLIGCRHQGANLRIEVWDTGKGIPEDRRKLIFEEFYQLDNPARETSKGMGLGLSIVDRLAHLLNHPIKVRSTLGKGSMFAITVPCGKQISEYDMQAQLSDDTLARVRILLIEDDPFVLEASTWLLQTHGAMVITARRGSEALQRIAERAPHPDIILADYRLPEKENGLQVIQRIRATLQIDIPAIIITGDTSAEAYAEAKTQGCRVLPKPMDIDQLISLIHRLLKGSGSNKFSHR